MFWRSLLVATISSHRMLLIPALKLLSVIATPRIGLLNVDKNPVLRGILKSTFYDHFCAGENGDEVRGTIARIKGMGFRGVILTYAREIVADASKGAASQESNEKVSVEIPDQKNSDIEEWREGVLQTVRMLGDGDFLAIKLTGAGGTVMQALASGEALPEQMALALKEVCEQAIHRKTRILVDAEQQSVQTSIDRVAMDLMQEHNRKGPAVVYNTYQAYLKSTPATLQRDLETAAKEGFTLGVKLVRGAYINSEPRHLINDTKAETDASYNSIAEGLLRQQYGSLGHGDRAFPAIDLFLATHNKESALAGHRLHSSRTSADQPTTKVQYGQLLGMADEVSCSLLQLGNEGRVAPEVYKCLSWGTLGDCLSYLLRRAVENRDAVSRTKDEYQALVGEAKRRIRSYITRS